MKKEDQKDILMKNHSVIQGLLDERRVADTFVLFEQSLGVKPDFEVKQRLEEIQSTYHYMLRYFKEDKKDPERDKQYLELVKRTYQVNDLLVDSLLLEGWNIRPHQECSFMAERDEVGWCKFFLDSKKELLRAFDENYQKQDLYNFFIIHQQVAEDFFDRLVEANFLSDKQLEQLYIFLNGGTVTEDVALHVSGVTLSALHFFDTKKVLFLMDAYKHKELMVSLRALVGLALVLHRYSRRLETEPEIMARLEELNENDTFREDVSTAFYRLNQALDAERIEKMMNEEFDELHNQLRASKDKNGLLNKMKENMNDGIGNVPFNRNLVRDVSKLQEEGYDTNLASFRHLKSDPYFARKMASWFYPFTLLHDDIYYDLTHMPVDVAKSLLTVVSRPNFCDSDKYSFVKMIYGMIKSGIKSNPFPENLEPLNEKRSWEEQKDDVLRLYANDLYRFAKLYPKHKEINFPMSVEAFRFTDSGIFPWLAKDEKLIHYLANDYYAHEHYEEALYYYQLFAKTRFAMNVKHKDQMVDAYIRMADCQEELEDFEAAAQSLKKAELLQPNNEEVLYSIAQCYRRAEKFDLALEYYEKLNGLEGNETNVLMAKALIFMNVKVKRYEEALKVLHQLEYYSPDKGGTLRCIAWCNFLLGNLELAEKYTERLMQKKGLRAPDYLNAGHVAWCRGHFDKALSLYLQSEAKSDGFDDFIDKFEADSEALMKNGISLAQLRLMRDTIYETVRSNESLGKKDKSTDFSDLSDLSGLFD